MNLRMTISASKMRLLGVMKSNLLVSTIEILQNVKKYGNGIS